MSHTNGEQEEAQHISIMEIRDRRIAAEARVHQALHFSDWEREYWKGYEKALRDIIDREPA